MSKEWNSLTALVTHHTVMRELLPCLLVLPWWTAVLVTYSSQASPSWSHVISTRCSAISSSMFSVPVSNVGEFHPLTLTVAIWVQLLKRPVPDQVKPPVVIFDIRALWRSALRVNGRNEQFSACALSTHPPCHHCPFRLSTRPCPTGLLCSTSSHTSVGGTAAAAPPPFRPGNPALCGSCPLVTPYNCRLGDLLCYTCMLYLSNFVCLMHV